LGIFADYGSDDLQNVVKIFGLNKRRIGGKGEEVSRQTDYLVVGIPVPSKEGGAEPMLRRGGNRIRGEEGRDLVYARKLSSGGLGTKNSAAHLCLFCGRE